MPSNGLILHLFRRFFTLDIDDSDVNFQEAEIDGYMFATTDEIKAFAEEGIFLHYDSIKKVFE